VALRFTRLDGLLVLMTVIWAGNYSVIKAAIREIPEVPFNAVRLLMASAFFLLALAWTSWRRAKSSPQHPRVSSIWSRSFALQIVALGIVGHFLYQVLFITGLARTSVANSALIIGCTPIIVAMLSVVLGQERTTLPRVAGALLSALGIYFVVGHGADASGQTLVGDFAMFGAVCCWSAATVGARPLLARHSPLLVTGGSITVGALLYLVYGWRGVQQVTWSNVPAPIWLAMIGSAGLALGVAYLIWYTAVQRLGGTRTSVYSNVVPLAAMLIAWIWLGEPIGALKIVGAGAIIGGVALTKLGGDGPGNRSNSGTAEFPAKSQSFAAS
jgi:drug/metabolite transporter (DMT)-like permease